MRITTVIHVSRVQVHSDEGQTHGVSFKDGRTVRWNHANALAAFIKKHKLTATFLPRATEDPNRVDWVGI